MSEEKAKLIKDLNSAGIDINFIIQESFLGYKYRKKVNKLYEEKAETPTKLIKMYYSLAPGKVEFDKMKKAFITKYINNESELEGTHNSIEIKGEKFDGNKFWREALEKGAAGVIIEKNNYTDDDKRKFENKLQAYTPLPRTWTFGVCYAIQRKYYIGLL